MSAFMFRASAESIRALTDEQLAQRRETLKARLASVNWKKLRQCTFDFDLAHGQDATLQMIEREIQLRASGTPDAPLPTAAVPGFNP